MVEIGGSLNVHSYGTVQNNRDVWRRNEKSRESKGVFSQNLLKSLHSIGVKTISDC